MIILFEFKRNTQNIVIQRRRDERQLSRTLNNGRAATMTISPGSAQPFIP